MTDQEKKTEEIKVVDKRRFTESGDENSENLKAPEDSLKTSSNSVESDSSKGPNVGGDIEFSSFVISLATQALVMLGEVPHPETNQKSVDLEAAKQMIDILGLMERKTKGNLTDQETHLLQEVLTSIRIAYVNKNK